MSEKRVKLVLENPEKCVILYLVTQRGEIHLKRNAMQDLIKWKSSDERKPMVMRGARQVGKTWLMKEFGQNYYDFSKRGYGKDGAITSLPLYLARKTKDLL